MPGENGIDRITIASGCGNLLGCFPAEDVAIADFKRFVSNAAGGGEPKQP